MIPLPTVVASRACGAVLTVAAMAFAAAAAAQQVTSKTPVEWLDAMDRAFRQLDYDGVFSYYTTRQVQVGFQQGRGESAFDFRADISRDVKLATFRIVHKVVDGTERERIVHLGGPQREILRTGAEVAYILQPGDESLAFEADIPAGPYSRMFMRGLDLGVNYRVDISGRGQVVGRPTVCLEITPLDDNRYGYLLWLDEATGLLLRSELREADGTHLEMVRFTQLRVGDAVATVDLEPAAGGVLVRHLHRASAVSPAPDVSLGWRVDWVPTGFRAANSHIDDPDDQVHLTFSDGLASFSVFIDAKLEGNAVDMETRSGATVVLTRAGMDERGDFLTTVAGEIPPSTAHQIATSVRREQ